MRALLTHAWADDRETNRREGIETQLPGPQGRRVCIEVPAEHCSGRKMPRCFESYTAPGADDHQTASRAEASQTVLCAGVFDMIDGNDNVWISNFAAIVELCGVHTENRPPGFKTDADRARRRSRDLHSAA